MGSSVKNAEILYSADKGTTKALGFRALARLCIIPYPRITTSKSPIMTGQWTERTREYAVFRFLLTGVDESAVTAEGEISFAPDLPPERPSISQDTLAEMIRDHEAELSKLTDNPDGIDAEETAIEEAIDKLQASIRNMEGRISQTSRQRKTVYDSYQRFGARVNE